MTKIWLSNQRRSQRSCTTMSSLMTKKKYPRSGW